MDLPKIKDQLMVKLFVGHLVKPEVIQSQIKQHRKLHQEKLDTLCEATQENNNDTSVNNKLAHLAIHNNSGAYFQTLDPAPLSKGLRLI